MRASRATRSVLPLVPNSRSNTARGSFSIGRGVVSELQAIVLVYAQLAPPSHEPSIAFDSMPSSSEASCVSFDSCLAAIWSIEMEPKTSAPEVSLKGTPVRKVPAERAWSPPPLTRFAGSSARPPQSSTRSLNAASDWSVGGISASGPSVFGNQYGIDIPFGT